MNLNNEDEKKEILNEEIEKKEKINEEIIEETYEDGLLDIQNVDLKNPKIFLDVITTDVRTLYKRWKDERGINLNPDFQRKDVWNISDKSRLIESAILNIPIPEIFFAETSTGIWDSIDGKQRLTTFFNYISNNFPLKLKDPELNGKYYRDLPPEYQRRIRNTKIRCTIVLKESDEIHKYMLFERLNTGAKILTQQELFNCLYHGKYNNLLKKLADNKIFKNYLAETKGFNIGRMRDTSLVHRFAAHYHSKYVYPLGKFLLADVKKYQNNITDKEMNDLSLAWKNTINMCYVLFGPTMFKRYIKSETSINGKWHTHFNVILFDVLTISLSKYPKRQINDKLDAIREAWIDLMTNDEFIKHCTQRTSHQKAYNIRQEMWESRLKTIIGLPYNEPRAFLRKTKEELYRANSYCDICGQHIISVDDAAVDHIQQYWLGGKTELSNARLAHRFCNNSRKRKEENIFDLTTVNLNDNSIGDSNVEVTNTPPMPEIITIEGNEVLKLKTENNSNSNNDSNSSIPKKTRRKIKISENQLKYVKKSEDVF